MPIRNNYSDEPIEQLVLCCENVNSWSDGDEATGLVCPDALLELCDRYAIDTDDDRTCGELWEILEPMLVADGYLDEDCKY